MFFFACFFFFFVLVRFVFVCYAIIVTDTIVVRSWSPLLFDYRYKFFKNIISFPSIKRKSPQKWSKMRTEAMEKKIVDFLHDVTTLECKCSSDMCILPLLLRRHRLQFYGRVKQKLRNAIVCNILPDVVASED